jgi:hypothetical protein
LDLPCPLNKILALGLALVQVILLICVIFGTWTDEHDEIRELLQALGLAAVTMKFGNFFWHLDLIQ